VIADFSAPICTFIFVFPFKNLLYAELFGLAGSSKMNDSKTASAYVGYDIPFFKGFLLGKAVDYAIKMNRIACILVLYGGRYVLYRFPAPGTIRLGKRLYCQFWRDPLGTLVKRPAFFFNAGIFGSR
jgi:hypothetical protein